MTPFEKYLQSLCCPYLTPLSEYDKVINRHLLLDESSDNIDLQCWIFENTFGIRAD